MAMVTDPPEVTLQDQLDSLDREIEFQESQPAALQAAIDAIPAMLEDLRAARARVAAALEVIAAPE